MPIRPEQPADAAAIRALVEAEGVARDQAQRRLVSQLDVTLPLGDQMEDDDTLGARLEHRGS